MPFDLNSEMLQNLSAYLTQSHSCTFDLQKVQVLPLTFFGMKLTEHDL